MAETTQETWSIDAGGAPLVNCTRCAACGKVMFPPQDYGCTGCGAFGAALSRVGLAAKGTLLSFAVVRVHEKHPTPFTLADVELGGGPIVRAEYESDRAPGIGDRLTGCVTTSEDGPRLTFAPEGP